MTLITVVTSNSDSAASRAPGNDLRPHFSTWGPLAGGLQASLDTMQENANKDVVLLDPVLFYARRCMARGTLDLIKMDLVSRYSRDELRAARNMLIGTKKDVPDCSKMWKGGQGPNQYPNRNGSSTKPASEFFVEDILQELCYLDGANMMPEFGVLLKDARRVPAEDPEDGNVVSISERMSRLEESCSVKLGRMEEVMTQVLALAKTKQDQQTRAPYNVVARKRSARASQAGQHVPVLPGWKRQSVGEETRKRPRLEDDEVFTTVERKKRSQNRAKVGTGAKCKITLESAPVLDRDILVTNVRASDESGELVRRCLEDQGIEVYEVDNRSREGYFSKSFRIKIHGGKLKAALDPEIWPTGAFVKRFWHSKEHWKPSIGGVTIGGESSAMEENSRPT